MLNIPSKVAKRLETIQCNFLWGDRDNSKKFHLLNWNEVKNPIKDGGLGLCSLVNLNKALLGRWIWRFWNEENSLWKRVISCKWFKGNPHDFSLIRKFNYGLSLGKNIMKLSDSVLQCSKWILGDGNKIRFWDDVWCGNETLLAKFPHIHAIARNKECRIYDVSSPDCLGLWNIFITRNLQDWEVEEYDALLLTLSNI